MHGDQEFECIRDELLGLHLHDGCGFLSHGITLETCTTNDHVGEVERSIQTIKEVVRATAHGMPYRRLPQQLIHRLVEYSTCTLNDFPYRNSVSKTLSPNTIVTGRPAPDYNDLKLEFGSYVMLTDRTTNTPWARTFGAIAMYPSGGRDGSYRFMSLATGEIVSKAPGYWTELATHPRSCYCMSGIHGQGSGAANPPRFQFPTRVFARPGRGQGQIRQRL